MCFYMVTNKRKCIYDFIVAGRSAETETERRRETKRMKKKHMNAGNWRGNFETRKQPIKRWDWLC